MIPHVRYVRGQWNRHQSWKSSFINPNAVKRDNEMREAVKRDFRINH